jgi:lysophospholipase L1-like esterase
MLRNNHSRTMHSCWIAIAVSLVACSEHSTTPQPPGAAGSGTLETPVTGTTAGAPAAGTGAAGSSTPTATAGRASSAESPVAGAKASAGTTGAAAGSSTSTAGANGGDVMMGNAGTGTAGTGTAGSTAGTGTAGAGAGGAAGMEAPMMPMDQGKGDGSDVITIGDSWMNIVTNGGGIEGGLDRLMTKYRHYAIAGTTLINGDIPAQYGRAKAANPKIATVIMTGGGNDVMFSGGCNTKEACTMSAQAIADALDKLWTEMAADGVKTTVYIQYSKYAGTSPMNTRPDTEPIPKICTSGKITCLSVPTTDLIAATDLIDGIHPTLAGCDRIAKATMEKLEMAGARR